MGLANVRRLVAVAAAVLVIAVAVSWLWRLEGALEAAELAERAAVSSAEALALSRAQAVQAREATARDLAAALAARPALEQRVARLRADLEAARARLGDAREGEDRVVEVISHAGEEHAVELDLPTCPDPVELEVRPGFDLARIATAGGRSVLEGLAWCEVGAPGAEATRVEDPLSRDVSEWLRSPEADTPARTLPPRELLAVEVELAASWRRVDGDLDAFARFELTGPELRILRGGQPFAAVEAELSGGALRDRYLAGAKWRVSLRR